MLLLWLSLLVFAATAVDVYEQVLSLSCDGELFFYPNHPELRSRLNVTSLKETYELGVQRLIERYSCPCPGITTDEIERTRAYYVPEFWLNKLTKRDNRTTCYEWLPPTGPYGWGPQIRTLQNLLMDFDLSHIDWSSCNSDTWKNGQGCTLQMFLPSLNVYLQLASKKCSSSQYFPYGSLSCKGQMCSKLLMPCNTVQECGGSRCHGFGYHASDNMLVGIGDLFQTLIDIYIYDEDDGGDTNLGLEFYEGLLSWGRKLIYGVTTPFKFSDAYYPFVDFTICAPSQDNLLNDFTAGCTSNSNRVVYCSALSAWDGKLGDGSSAFSADRLDGTLWRNGSLAQQEVVPVSPDNDVLLDFTCSGQVSLLPNLPLAAPGLIAGLKLMGNSYSLYDQGWILLAGLQPTVLNVPWLNQIFSIAYNFLQNVEQQRALLRGSTLSPQAFELTWSWQQFLYDWVYAPQGNPPVDHGPPMSSWRQSMIDYLLAPQGTFFQIPLPSTCSYDRWVKEGNCSGDYTGFGDLFGIDLTIRFSAKSCGDLNTVPSFQFQCVGSACKEIFYPISCQSNSNCPANFLCQPATTPMFSSYNFDPLFFAAIIEGNTNNYLNDTRNAKCAGTQYYLKDSVYILNKLGQTQQNTPSICMLNYTILQQPQYHYPVLDAWAQRAYSGIRDLGNVREVLLNFFKSWM